MFIHVRNFLFLNFCLKNCFFPIAQEKTKELAAIQPEM